MHNHIILKHSLTTQSYPFITLEKQKKKMLEEYFMEETLVIILIKHKRGYCQRKVLIAIGETKTDVANCAYDARRFENWHPSAWDQTFQPYMSYDQCEKGLPFEPILYKP